MRVNRREFVKNTVTASLGLAASGLAATERKSEAKRDKDLIWGNLLHLSYNMWEDRPEPKREERYYRPFLRFDENLWNDLLKKMAASGLNMVVIDLGDGVEYKSHPEIAVKNAWSVPKLKSELKKIRDLGLEPIPKLNFSTAHDTWLGEYAQRVSTEKYYSVCRDLLSEVVEIFDQPRLFHLGMDEETHEHQRYYSISIVRQFEIWWHDLYFLIDVLKSHNVRPWMWSDYLWRHRSAFFAKMPKTVLQSNWYYGIKFKDKEENDKKYVTSYNDLDDHGYDQIPTGSNWSHPENFGMMVEYCRKYIHTEHLLGFLQTPWKPTLEKFREHHYQAIEQVKKARKKYKYGVKGLMTWLF